LAQVEREEEEARQKQAKQEAERKLAEEEGRPWQPEESSSVDGGSEEDEEHDSSDEEEEEGGLRPAPPRRQARAQQQGDFRFHLPGRPQGFDPAAPATLTGISVWHPHTLTQVGFVPLASATALCADQDQAMMAVGGEQTLTYWHTS
jgi:hypothetical protein